MTLTEKLEGHIQTVEDRGYTISQRSNTQLLSSYYRRLGVDHTTGFAEWLHGVSTGLYPAYGSITRAIRKARENNPSWRKARKQVDKEVTQVANEVGYAK